MFDRLQCVNLKYWLLVELAGITSARTGPVCNTNSVFMIRVFRGGLSCMISNPSRTKIIDFG